LLIVKPDAIGDYILFRNFLEDIRNSALFKNHHITLCGNVAWRDLAESLDSGAVDRFIWLDRKRLLGDIVYRDDFLRQIREGGFSIAFHPVYSRELLTGDSIVLASGAAERIGFRGDDASEISVLKRIGDSWYTQLFTPAPGSLHEFTRNREIVEHFVAASISRERPALPLRRKDSPGRYAVVFPGAGEKQKLWPAERFAEVARDLTGVYNLHLKICGSAADKPFADVIAKGMKGGTVEDLCGCTTLLQLAEIIAQAAILVTNDSAAVHLAIATGTPCVCVLHGRHFGRFAPYPVMPDTVHFVYPESINRLREEDPASLAAATKHVSFAGIEDVSIEQVRKSIAQLLG
jgi:ADP-heptose:LPS heptosyltransferase